MRVYVSRDSHSATDDMTATRTTVRHLTSRVEDLGHEIFIDNFFSSQRLFDDLDRRNKFMRDSNGPTEKTFPVTLDQNN